MLAFSYFIACIVCAILFEVAYYKYKNEQYEYNRFEVSMETRTIIILMACLWPVTLPFVGLFAATKYGSEFVREYFKR